MGASMSTIACGSCKKLTDATEVVALARYKCNSCNKVNEIVNISVREWVGFNYDEYLEAIKEFIDTDSFENLAAQTPKEISLGRLNPKQINRLKLVLKDSLENGRSIRHMSGQILDIVKVKDLEVVNENGDVTRRIPKQLRAVNIARTETVRVSNQGSLLHYDRADIKEYSWVASMSDRTCPDCEGLNGQIFPMGQGPVPPFHNMCRCSIIPVVNLN